MQKIYSAEEHIEVNSHYIKELTILRHSITSTERNESIKWSIPIYSLKGKNVLGIGAFKNHFCL